MRVVAPIATVGPSVRNCASLQFPNQRGSQERLVVTVGQGTEAVACFGRNWGTPGNARWRYSERAGLDIDRGK
jgi:hypothetical protein